MADTSPVSPNGAMPWEVEQARKYLKRNDMETREKSLRKVVKSEKVVKLLMKPDYTDIQMLLFHYLELIEKIPVVNTKKKILLSIIFKTKGFENIRTKLSDIKELKTKENLEILADLFAEFKMETALKKVENDLAKKMKIEDVK